MLSSSGRRNIYWVLFAILLSAFVIHSRLRYYDPFLFNWDSVQFALSTEHFDVRLHQPHPPGYILYSGAVRTVNHMVNNPNLSMIYMNIAATIAAALLLACLVGAMNPDLPALERSIAQNGAALLYVVNAVISFEGSVAEIYAVDGFFAALILALLVASNRNPNRFLWASLAMAVAGGFRPTTEIFLIPAYLAFAIGKERRLLLNAAVVLIIANLLWIVPLAVLSGGFERYLRVAFRQTESAVTGSIPSAPRSVLAIRLIMVPGILLLAVLLLKMTRWRFNRERLIVAASLLPAFLFYEFVHFAKDGYLIIMIPAVIATVCSLVVRLYKAPLAALFILLTIAIHYHLYRHPDLYPAADAQAGTLKWTLNQFQTPNRYVTSAHQLRMQSFMASVENNRRGRILFVLDNTTFPDWRSVMYYYPKDLSLLILSPSKAHLAENHQFSLIHTSLDLSPEISTLVFITNRTAPFAMKSFTVFEYTAYYAFRKEIPDDFTLSGFAFHKMHRH